LTRLKINTPVPGGSVSFRSIAAFYDNVSNG
jgi:hypothetical protein